MTVTNGKIYSSKVDERRIWISLIRVMSIIVIQQMYKVAFFHRKYEKFEILVISIAK